MSEEKPARREREIAKHPEKCPSCQAVLQDVPFPGVSCPHCGYDLEENPMGYSSDKFKVEEK